MALRASILVADDDETSARFLKRLLTREGHDVSVVHDADQAITVCREEPPDLVLVDLVAPRGQGFDVCRRIKDDARTRLIPVVIVTAQGDRGDRLKGIQAGCNDFLTKPFDSTELHARIQSLVRLKRYTDELESAEAVILGLGATIEARDPSTNGHCQRLAHYATTLGRSLGLDAGDLAALERGGFLHDIGKIAVPDRVLLKDGKLDPQESRVMRKHPIVGDSLCAGLRSLNKVRPIVRHHHERLDGTGYPDGLRNGEVPLLAQIVSIVDVFDALTTVRPYRAACLAEEAFQVLTDEAGKGWRDRNLVDAFIAIIEPRTPDA
ncbi:MAG TPA: HD domain-containing phosphohydrolase [Vicinamibacterales bacterium]|nr:HD domain-containing phosphohydrolase [Vicinamibacterales bacterium]